MICVVCRRKGAKPATLPLTGDLVALCARCWTAAYIRAMRKLVAHGAVDG